jgi:hypothetical protein
MKVADAGDILGLLGGEDWQGERGEAGDQQHDAEYEWQFHGEAVSVAIMNDDAAQDGIIVTDFGLADAEEAEEPENEDDDQHEAERAAEAGAAVIRVAVIAAAAAEKEDQQNDD